MHGKRILLTLAGAAVLGGPAKLDAQVSPLFRADVWDSDKGLPSAFVSDMVATGDGYLWLAAGGVLARFDGHEFKVYSVATDSAFTARVNALYAGVGDTLWIGLDDGWILSLARGRVAKLAQLRDRFGYLVQDERGALVAVSWFGIDRWESTRFQRLTYPSGIAPWVDQVRPIVLRDSTGVVWVPDTSGTVFRVTSRGIERTLIRAARLVNDRARGRVLFARRSSDGGAVIDSTGAVVARYRGRGMLPFLIDRERRLWAASEHAVFVFAPGQLDAIQEIRFQGSGDLGNAIEDAEGNIWAAGNGIARIQESAFRTVTRAAGLTGNDKQIDKVSLGPNGSVLARVTSGDRHGMYRFDGFRATLLRPIRPFEAMEAAADQRGTTWVSYFWGPRSELMGDQLTGPDLVVSRRAELHLADDPTRPGSIWFSTPETPQWVYRAEPYAPGGPRIADSLPAGQRIRTMAVAPDGAVWLVLADVAVQELVRHHRGGTQRWTAADGLPTTDVRALLPDADGSVWLGTYGAGLMRLRDGRFEAVRAQHGLAEDIVSSIVDDGAGNFWMGGNRWIHRVRIDDARAVLDGRAARVVGVPYGRRDGLSDPETTGRPGVRASDGRLWFPTFGGAGVVDAARALALDSTPPSVHVLGVQLASDSLVSHSGARLPRGERRVSVVYTGIALRNPEGVRFQYRLEGVDDDWIDAGASRVAVYNDVGPGTHTFRVRARNGGGVWSAAEATMAFVVPPFFYETFPFYSLMAALLAALAFAAIRFRERRSRAREAELSGLVGARTADLGKALIKVEAQAAQLRTLDEAKSRFFANVSHEFRTPLSLIQGPVEDVREGRAGPVSDMARRRLDTVTSNVKRLVQLVEQLLDVARLESGTLQLHAEVRDLVPALRRITESFSSLAERRGLSFHVSCPVGGIRVRFDPDQMEKIVGNLLGNALKFTPTGGRVELRARTEADGQPWAVIEVADTGPGIPEEHQARVFDRFYQVDDSARRTHEGAGIGLALARELVDLHGGQLTLRSTMGAGSTFIVRLPLAAPAVAGAGMYSSSETAVASQATQGSVSVSVSDDGAPEPAPASGDSDRADVTTVLVAEDNAELLAWLRDRLADQYRVIEAPNGARALALAREHVPDLIISDVMMPELDGQSLVQAVKADPEIDFVPIILLTAKASRESRLAGLEVGADDYLHKPVDIKELMVRANNLIVSRRRLRERFAAAQRDLPTLEVPLKPGQRDAGTEAFLKKFYEAVADRVADESVNVDTLASAVGMGRSTLYRKVEEVLGRSPMDAVWEYRLEQAAQWLAETDANVSEIAYGVGFKSVPHFCSRFRARFQATPSAYRRQKEVRV